ncbi:MAG: ABC transporter substrate-binding protein [Candidatus Vogelbacteria bacterium]|nr:ABC transporter substrate-binding protein [Candidatus Vogelbacteria bacterium]
MSFSSGQLPLRQEIYRALSSFSLKQKLLLLFLAVIFIGSIVALAWKLNDRWLVTVAVPGGTLTEGIVGFPAHGNPLFAITDPDRDLAALVYSGLLKIGKDGLIIPDLAQSYTVSADGLSYDFKLRAGLSWQDGTPLTADDVVFTIGKIQDPAVKSPRRAAWEGVRAQKIGGLEVRFSLKKPYSAFLENATIGLLPKHLWQEIKSEAFSLSEYNIKGVGSGPYRIVAVEREPTGLPAIYRLEPFKNYAGGEPKITSLILHFYKNDETIRTAYERGEIDSFGSIPPTTAALLKKNGANVQTISLPRIFAAFFNQNDPVLSDRTVRSALSLTTDKNSLIKNALQGAGVAINGPIPPGSEGYLADRQSVYDPKAAAELLEKAGWKKGVDGIWAKTDKKNKTVRLEFNLSTAAAPELKSTAELLVAEWNQFGAKVTVSIYDLADLDQNLIRPRKFSALLFGEILGRDPDLYSFWHSSQRLAPGLNITQYANSTADKLLEDARRSGDPEIRTAKYEKFQTELAKDNPAIFLYSPYFLYILPAKVKGADFPSLIVPSERFATIADWYIAHDRVWKIFTTKQ